MSVALAIARRLAGALAVIAAVAAMNFMLVRLAPGDPATIMAGQAGGADEEYVAQLRKEFGLDHSLPVQMVNYAQQLVHFNFGYSYRQGQTVLSLITARLPNTILLTATAFVISLVVGVSAGAFAAALRGTWVDTIIGLVALLFYATPIFFTGLVFLLIFSATLNWLPGFGTETVGSRLGIIGELSDRLQHLVLPACTLAVFYTATYVRLTRTSVLEALQQDFVKTARAKGLPPGRVMRAHVLRNAVLPVITVAGMQAGQLIGGAVVVETVFGWPGIGRLAFEALLQRDYAILMGIFIVTSTLVVLLNLLTEIGYRLFDPRVGAT